MQKIKIGVFVGSSRKNSYSRMVADAMSKMLPDGFDLRLIKIDHLEMFNQDYDDEGRPPEAWKAFRREVSELDGFLFITPEYNRSVPPLLINALDIGSRPKADSVWDGKPGGIVSVTPGQLGALSANQQLRNMLAFLNVYVMPHPEMYFESIADILDENGKFTDPLTEEVVNQFIHLFAAWVINFMQMT